VEGKEEEAKEAEVGGTERQDKERGRYRGREDEGGKVKEH